MTAAHRPRRSDFRSDSHTVAVLTAGHRTGARALKLRPPAVIRELIELITGPDELEDIFPTQRIQMPTRDTQPLRGQW